MMTTRFVTLDVPLPDTADSLNGAIHQALTTYGVPLRWAITSIDRDRRVACLEAVVTVEQSA